MGTTFEPPDLPLADAVRFRFPKHLHCTFRGSSSGLLPSSRAGSGRGSSVGRPHSDHLAARALRFMETHDRAGTTVRHEEGSPFSSGENGLLTHSKCAP